jgi:type II secretion system protein H
MTRERAVWLRSGRVAAGFTLIEVILVVLIIGLIAALAIPSFDNALRGQRLDSAAHEIATACQQARYEAVFGNRSCWYVLDMDTQRIRLMLGKQADTNGVPTYEEIAAETNLVDSTEGQAAESVEMPTGVRITKVQSQDGTIQDSGKIGFPFYSNGVCEPFRVFLVSDNGEQRALDVDMFTGKAKVFTPQ